MVWKIAGEARTDDDKQQVPKIKLPKTCLRAESLLATIVIVFVKVFLFVYDLVSWPIYYVIQRPDKCAIEAQRIRSERVDANTWIRTSRYPNGIRHTQIPNLETPHQMTKKFKHMGSTMCEIFANSIKEYSCRPCLGYRAVVTCPVMSLDEQGRHVLRDRSFRSDYTWYTYGQIGCRVQDIASGLYSNAIYPGSKVLFLVSSSLEWFCAAQACFQLGVQIVLPPDPNVSTSYLKMIIEEASIKAIFISCNELPSTCCLLDSIRNEKDDNLCKIESILRLIVIIDWQFSVDFNEKIFARLQESSRDLVDDIVSIGQLEELGAEDPIELSCSKALNESNLRSNSSDNLSLSPTPKQETRARNISDAGQHQLLSPPRASESFPPSTIPLRRRTVADLELPFHSGSVQSSAGSSLHGIDNKNLSSPKQLSRSNSKQQLENSQPKPQDLAAIVYTFGSMGQLKPIMLTHTYLARSNQYLFLDGMVGGDDIHCATLSLDNVIEFMTEMCIFSHGGCIGYSDSLKTLFYDGSDLFERDKSDLEALKPTFLLVRPYMLESLRTSVLNYLHFQANPLMSLIMINVLFEYKKKWAKQHFGTPIVDRLFCAQLKQLFGSRIKYILCKGATDCSETKDFFTFMVDAPVIELYGPDEAVVSLISVNDIWDYKRRVNKAGRQQHQARRSVHQSSSLVVDGTICTNGRSYNSIHDEEDECNEDDDADESIKDFSDVQLLPPRVNKNIFRKDRSKNLLITSSILCPTLGSRIRLEDWEDFRTSDEPYPRGRLVIGGDGVCEGYYCRPDTTASLFYKDSNSITWFRTNDIARVFPNGSFEIISAMSDMFKLADGQFISLSQIEHVIRNSQFVENVCSILSDDRRLVVNLVVPNLRRLALKSPGEANLKIAIGLESEPEELIDIEFRREVCNDRLLCEFVSNHLVGIIEQAGLKTVTHRFLLVPEIWTPETELVTTAYEPKRSAIQKFYATDIQSIFQMESLATSSKKLSLRRRLSNSNRTSKATAASSDSLLSLRTI